MGTFFKWTEDNVSTTTPTRSVSRCPNRTQEPVSGRSAQSKPRLKESNVQWQSQKPTSSPIRSTTPLRNEGGEAIPDGESSKRVNESPLTSTPIAEAGHRKAITLTTADDTTVWGSDTGMKMPDAGDKQPVTKTPSTLVRQDSDKSVEVVEESMRSRTNQFTEPGSICATGTTAISSALATVSTPVDPITLSSVTDNINTESATRVSVASPPDTSISSSESPPKTDVGDAGSNGNTGKVNQAESQQPSLPPLHYQAPKPGAETLLTPTNQTHLPLDLITFVPPPLSPPQQDLLELALSEQENCEHESDDQTTGPGGNMSHVTGRNSRPQRETGANVFVEPLQMKAAVVSPAVLEAEEPAVLPPLSPDRLHRQSPPIQEHPLHCASPSPSPSLEQHQPLLVAQQQVGVTSVGQSIVEDLDGREVHNQFVSIPPAENDDVQIKEIQQVKYVIL